MKNLDCKYSHQRQDAGIFEANKNFSWGLKGSTMCVWKMKATKAQYSIKNPMGLLANGMLIWTVPVWLHLWNFQQQSHMEVGGLMDKTLPPLWTEPHRYEGEESHCPRASWNTHVEYTGEPVIMVIKTKRVSVCVGVAVTAGPSEVCMSRKWRSRRGEGLEPQTHLGLGPEQAPPSLPLWLWPHPIAEQGHMTSHIMLLSYHMRCTSVGTCRVHMVSLRDFRSLQLRVKASQVLHN